MLSNGLNGPESGLLIPLIHIEANDEPYSLIMKNCTLYRLQGSEFNIFTKIFSCGLCTCTMRYAFSASCLASCFSLLVPAQFVAATKIFVSTALQVTAGSRALSLMPLQKYRHVDYALALALCIRSFLSVSQNFRLNCSASDGRVGFVGKT